MKSYIATLPATLLILALTSGTLQAQGSPQPINAKRVDVVQLATGYRASKIDGAPVFNHSHDKIGTIDDLIIGPNNPVPYAILSVGGFLGMGTHLVAVPWNSLQIVDRQMRLPDATKESLKALPEFRYAPD
ncbi:PRC-barrel domain-containing protein [Paraburkholderia sp. MMS20-SJTN17]|uniref:PRC-barrel domain-containing protein n=1 Tax=Paraburkholderia translucens TaxID=2886945 RepID=A0ABS8KF07_9BURK|nr:PRC-barrel domain-containing protein [Paraburkholderia sp. MMS20-SJTN17]MCC8403365.1 PRC-barrel domain-containing protein [Paraburkholderia sp. MMS20-SJTN17]